MSRRAAVGDVESRITLRFTALVVAVLVSGIAIYVMADTMAAEVRLDATLRLRAERLAQRISRVPGDVGLPAEARIVSTEAVLIAGEQVREITELGPVEGFGYVDAPQGRLRVFAVPLGDGRSLQLLDAARPDVIDTLEIASVLLLVTVMVGAITYLLGLRFSRQALAPVRESMARLERFTADAGHELRTPLASVRASLDVGERTGDWAGAVGRARVELEHASMLVDRLLELARLDPSTLRLERVEWAWLSARVLEACSSMAEERGISVAIEGARGEVSADPILLERLVMNLVGNAIRFADLGSAVTVRFSADAIEVHNLGVPIPPDELARVFEPFYQSDRSRTSEGSGLGLAIVAAIAQAHGWPLDAASTREDGTTFRVHTRFPRRSSRP
ncbi:MAG: HAMP domain-containing sensor histidine kinase [Coriobacteriia bacterium]|nr:HAMP domain-containing sensor histidine kinase [Coriobacteriia bacterium]